MRDRHGDIILVAQSRLGVIIQPSELVSAWIGKSYKILRNPKSKIQNPKSKIS
jgi:hypothetical protein